MRLGQKLNSFESFLDKLFLAEEKLRLLLGEHAPLCFGFREKCRREALEVAVLAYACCKGKEDTNWSQKPRHLSPIPTSFAAFIKSLHLYALLLGNGFDLKCLILVKCWIVSNNYFAEEGKCTVVV